MFVFVWGLVSYVALGIGVVYGYFSIASELYTQACLCSEVLPFIGNLFDVFHSSVLWKILQYCVIKF